MGKRLISEQDIRQAADQGRRSVLAPAAECIVTPMARDAAALLDILLVTDGDAEAGDTPAPAPAAAGDTAQLVARVVSQLRSRLPAGVSAERLSDVVRDVVTERLAAPAGTAATPGGGAQVRLIPVSQALRASSPAPGVDGQATLAELLAPEAGGGLAAGLLAWEKAAFERTVEKDEVDIVVAGELQVECDGQTLSGGPGDLVFLPRGARVVYRSDGSVQLVCVNRA